MRLADFILRDMQAILRQWEAVHLIGLANDAKRLGRAPPPVACLQTRWEMAV